MEENKEDKGNNNHPQNSKKLNKIQGFLAKLENKPKKEQKKPEIIKVFTKEQTDFIKFLNNPKTNDPPKPQPKKI